MKQAFIDAFVLEKYGDDVNKIIDKFLHSDFTVSFEDNDGILRVNLKFNYFVKASELYNVIQFFQSMDCKFLGLYSNMISFVKGEKK